MRRTRKSCREVTHNTLGLRFLVVGARVTESGNCFAVIEEINPARERLFLTSCFTTDITFVERESLFLELMGREQKRLKKLAADATREARMQRAQEQSEWSHDDPDQDQDDALEAEPAITEFETIAPEDSCGDPIEEEPEEEIEIFED